MGLLDKFLDAIKLNDDYDDDDEFLDGDDDLEDDESDYKEEKPKKRFFQRFDDEDDDLDDEDYQPVKKSDSSYNSSGKKSYSSSDKKTDADLDRMSRSEARPVRRDKDKDKDKDKASKRSKITSINRKKGAGSMEVNVIRPSSMEDAREIADTLLEECTVVLNLEGLDVDVAQRIIDFTCGACYSLDGSLQKVSSYIYILAPSNVDISGDFQSILDGAFDIPSMNSQY